MSKNKIIFLLLLLFVLMPLFSLGKTESEEERPSLRIVSLAPNITEIVCELGAEENLVGRTEFCTYPENVKNIQSIGTMWEPDIEMIISLRPDVVIASSIVNPEIVERLNGYGIRTYQFLEEYNGIEGAFNLIINTGRVIGKEKEAYDFVNIQKTRLSELKAKLGNIERKTAVILISWGDFGDYGATGDTFLGEVLQAAGGINIANQAKYWSVSKELLLSRDPEYVFLADDNPCDFINSLPYSHLSACKNSKVFYIDSDSAQRQGIRTVYTVERLASLMYPEIFR